MIGFTWLFIYAYFQLFFLIDSYNKRFLKASIINNCYYKYKLKYTAYHVSKDDIVNFINEIELSIYERSCLEEIYFAEYGAIIYGYNSYDIYYDLYITSDKYYYEYDEFYLINTPQKILRGL